MTRFITALLGLALATFLAVPGAQAESYGPTGPFKIGQRTTLHGGCEVGSTGGKLLLKGLAMGNPQFVNKVLEKAPGCGHAAVGTFQIGWGIVRKFLGYHRHPRVCIWMYITEGAGKKMIYSYRITPRKACPVEA